MYLNVFTSGHLLKVLLLLQSFVHFVIRHTEATQAGLHRVVHFGKHHKLGHVGHADELSVELSGQTHSLRDLMAVCQPKSGDKTKLIMCTLKMDIEQVRKEKRSEVFFSLPGRNVCGEGHAVIHECEWCGTSDVLPLSR